MSELLSFHVVSVIGSTVQIRATTVHPDQYDIPSSKNFALQIIVEAYWRIREKYLQTGPRAAPLSAHPRRRELDKLVEHMFGADIEITEAEYEAMRGKAALLRAEGVSSIGMRTVAGKPRYIKNRGPAYRTFIREAEQLVERIHLESERNNPREDADDPDAEATVVIAVADSSLLSHLTAGLSWDSAIYDFHGWEDHDKSDFDRLN